MDQHFPLRDGAICFNDGYNFDHVREGEPVTCTLPVIGRYLYEDYGRVVYHPGYKSLYCDAEQTHLFTAMNRMAFVDEVVIEHRHFAAGKARFDELYQRNAQPGDSDRALFEERRACKFDASWLTLSILICSMPSRRAQLDRLIAELRRQTAKQAWAPRAYRTKDGCAVAVSSTRWFTPIVEICVDIGDGTVGIKRQRLLERARGAYVCFVDDDDGVTYNYVERVLRACTQDKDCCSLVGVMTTDGERPERFEHSLKHNHWETISRQGETVHVRPPNHLNVVRRELALRVGFVDASVGEDHDFSTRLRPLLQSEGSTGDEPLYYYRFVPSKSVQSC
jgi:hypothetical protein